MGKHSSGQLVVYGVAAVVLVVVGARLLAPGTPEPAAAPARIAVDAGDPSEPSAGGARHGRGVYVHVAGAVRRPGIYRLPADARVSAAVKRARGPTPGAEITAVNLAAPVQDGQQVVVPRRGEAGAASTGGAAAGAGAGTERRVSLSQATPEQLDELDGIGPALAERIVEHRTAHGGFRSVEELNQVEGIGPKRFEALRAAVDP